jgi:hypothetical protein
MRRSYQWTLPFIVKSEHKLKVELELDHYGGTVFDVQDLTEGGSIYTVCFQKAKQRETFQRFVRVVYEEEIHPVIKSRERAA